MAWLSSSATSADGAAGAAGTVRRWAALPWRPWSPPARRTVVLVAHPDDEVLGAGGLILTQLARQVPVVLITATDGEAAPSDRPAHELRWTRRLEQAVATERLGLGPAGQVHCSLPDGALAEHQGELTDCLLELLRPGDLLVAPWRFDHHPDHEACGRAAFAAARAMEVATAWSLVWAPVRTEPPGEPHLPLRRLALRLEDVHRRRWALDAHRSQLQTAPEPTGEPGGAQAGSGRGPVVDAELQARLEDPSEWFVTDLP